MPKHSPRTIWKPSSKQGFAMDGVSSAPQAEVFKLIRDVDADDTQGLALKHIQLVVAAGIDLASPPADNSMTIGGWFGFFKWPKDAATPTAATIDLSNRGSIFGRTNFIVMGSQPRYYTKNVKSARLRLGDALWCFAATLFETDASVLWNIHSQVSWWETEA